MANNVVRLETNGARDTTFDSAAAAGPSAFNIRAVLLRPSDDKIFLGGYFSTFGGESRTNLAWVNPDGSLDAALDGLSGVTDYAPQIYALATQPDGKILVGGSFSSFNGTSRYNLVRLNPDTTIDPSFDPAFQSEGSVRAIHLQPDGKIVIAGNIRAIKGVAHGSIARLNLDGTLDPSFNPGIGADFTVLALAQDSAGNIYVGGNFENFNGTPRARVAKLSPAGVLDAAFDPGLGSNSTVFAIAPADAAGGVIIGGALTHYDGVSVGRIARLNAATGARDSSFNSGGAGFVGQVRALKLRPDGKYYVGGSFSSYNGVPRSRMARLHSDGSLDSGFQGPVLNGSIHALALQNDKVLAGGTTSFDQPLRFTSTGALDATFDVGSGVENLPANAFSSGPTISAFAIQPDGKALVGGIFNRFNGAPRVGLARLKEPLFALKITSIARLPNGHIVLQGIGDPNTIYTIQTSPDLSPDSFGAIGLDTSDNAGAWEFEDTGASGTRRFYRAILP